MFDFLTAINRVAFYLPGGRPVYWYGIMVTLGILAAFGLFILISYKKGIDLDFSLELFLWVVPLAVVFCRVFYVVPRIGTEYRLDSWDGFVDMLNISNGGLTIIGGIFGGALGIFFCCLRNRKYTFAQVADCVVIALLLGQIIGRWGNFFNQELYGVEVTQEWMKHFPLAVYIESTGTWHYASFFYEGVLNAIGLAVALVIFFVPKKPVKRGTIMIFYVGWYGLVRGSLEFIKGTDPMTIGNTQVKMVQLICYIMFIVAIVLMILLQTGKIRFETKWFQRLCEKKKEQDLAKQLAAESADGGETAQADDAQQTEVESSAEIVQAENTQTETVFESEENIAQPELTQDNVQISENADKAKEDKEESSNEAKKTSAKAKNTASASKKKASSKSVASKAKINDNSRMENKEKGADVVKTADSDAIRTVKKTTSKTKNASSAASAKTAPKKTATAKKPTVKKDVDSDKKQNLQELTEDKKEV